MKSHYQEDNILRQGEELIVTGKLTQESVMKLLACVDKLLPAAATLKVNLAQVTHCDSASLAFLIQLLRKAKKMHTKLTFIEMPNQMQQLSKVCAIDDLLPIS